MPINQATLNSWYANVSNKERYIAQQERLEDEREEFFEERSIWLENLGCTGADVLTDEFGTEFILSDNESGTAGDDYQVDSVRVDLPPTLQMSNLNF